MTTALSDMDMDKVTRRPPLTDEELADLAACHPFEPVRVLAAELLALRRVVVGLGDRCVGLVELVAGKAMKVTE